MTQFADECRETQQQIQQTADEIQNWMRQLFQPFDQLQSQWQAVEETSVLMNQTVTTLRPYFSSIEAPGAKAQTRRRAGAKKWMLHEIFKTLKDRADRLHQLLVYNDHLKENLRFLTSRDQSEEGGLEAIISQITKTQKIIIDVKFISLNAIIFAIHLGEKGASFERVSDHLHETSVFIDKGFSEIIDVLNLILQWNDNFNAHLSGILSTQEKVEVDVLPNLHSIFERVESATKHIESYYRELNGLLDMMNNDYHAFNKKLSEKGLYLQILDKWLDGFELIREQHDRLSELVSYDAPAEQQLDYITFVHKGLEAMTFVAPFAVNSLQRYSDEIWQLAIEGHERMVEIKPALQGLSEQFGAKEQVGEVQATANGIATFLDELKIHLMKIGIIETCLEDCTPFNHEINEHFHELENGLKVVSEEVSMLDIIRFLSHVELAKVDQSTLKSFGVEIDGVVIDVTQAIASNAESLIDVKKTMSKLLNAFKEVRLTNQRRYNDEMYHVGAAQERLLTIQSNLTGGFEGLSGQSSLVIEAYERVIESLTPVRDAVEQSVALVQTMTIMKERMASNRQQLLNQLQVQRWDIKNAELSELSVRFQDLISEFQLMEGSRRSSLSA